MPAPDVSAFTHSHQFNHVDAKAERNTRRVVYITAAMMVVEIAGGYWLNSMALLADGWHMSSHALAMGLSVMAYALARRYAKDGRFAFGTWKIEILGGYSSALLLAVVAALMMVQSLERLFVPATIHYDDAILIAVLGLGVNLLCAWLLKCEHPHAHGHAHGHDHGHGHGQGPHGRRRDAEKYFRRRGAEGDRALALQPEGRERHRGRARRRSDPNCFPTRAVS